MKYIKFLVLLFALLSAVSCKSNESESIDKNNSSGSKTATLQNDNIKQKNKESIDTVKEEKILQDVFSDIKIVRELPHDTQAYTQGLIYFKGLLYESTGQYGESSLRKLDPKTGAILLKTELENQYFAEGIAIFNNKIYQLTWRSGTGFVYDLMTMKQTGTFTYYGEGWGITADKKYLIMSDGTNALRFLDPKTFEIVKTIFVVDENSIPLQYLNELEYINGEIWANVYTRNYIVRINPDDGRVISRIDLSFLIDKIEVTPETDVLNGIAYDKKRDEYYFTGKNWNKIFVIKMK
jgi:glutamine cyclotransferase